MRLSRAGAQDKLAGALEADGRRRLPHRGEPSTHILTPDSRRFRGLRDAEALGLALAGRVGLAAASARLVDAEERTALLIERYDSVRAPDGTRQRLPHEVVWRGVGCPEGRQYGDTRGSGRWGA